jgi:MYXO-CTERM domain-containing protein
LDEKVMRPLRPLLGPAKRLIVSPDGTLNFIPFEALVDENGQFLIERWSMSYVTSGRDVFRWSRHAPSRSGAVILANPAFGEIVKRTKKESESSNRGTDRTGISRLGFTPLLGTAQEGEAILKQLSHATLYAGEKASKEHIIELAGPKILHIATHGFFMGDMSESAASNTRGFTLEVEPPPPLVLSVEDARPPLKASPLLRSGLALSGANARGEARSGGILTALEASGLDLEGTKLVVLSACETGLGQATSGEGVEGLRRAFVLAGAETTVMSLWKVDDAATRDMMIGYYQRLESGEGRSEALRQVRLGMLANNATAHPFYWASFIVAGDPSRFDGTIPATPPPVARGPRGCACAVAGESNENGAGGVALLIAAASMIRIWRRKRLS